ncbi:MAG: shikimate kinase [Brachymonas sp.]|nr:shikimate kinase [Brachymonas sp.]
MQNIILIGLPGSGKTSAGRRVARHFSWPFADSDEVLESALGMRIKEYFAAHGEDAFRDQEARVLQELLAQQGPFVLSTGGGAVLRAENRQLLRSGGAVFYLHASPEAIYRRLKHDTQRPLLQVPDPLAKIRSLFEERELLYRETAHHIIPCGRSSVTATAQRIIQKIQTGE